MATIIQDGTGNGYSAKVDERNMLSVLSVSKDLGQYASLNGDAYFAGTPAINLTSASPSAVFFLENNENDPLLLLNFFITASASTGGTLDMMTVSWYKNPTNITPSTATQALNQNFGSAETLNATITYGAEASAVTGGTLAAQLYLPIKVLNDISANLTMEKGSKLAIVITPPPSNTSMNVQFGVRSIKHQSV